MGWGKEVSQTCDMSNGHGQIERRFTIRREKGAILRGVLIEIHAYVKGLVDLVHCAADRHNQAIRGRTCDGETAGLGERNDGLIILDSGTELLGELLHAEELAVIGAGGVV
jgi:hypothetical protein